MSIRDAERCNKIKKDGNQCQSAAMENGKCRVHGGKALRGIAHAGYKTGKFSKVIPKSLKAAYERAINDPNILSLRDEVGLLEAREVELVEKLSKTPEPPWKEVHQAISDMLTVDISKKGERETLPTLILNLSKLVSDGVDIDKSRRTTWNELRDLIQDKARVSGLEFNRLAQMQQLLTKEKALHLIWVVIDAVKKNVTDRVALTNIQNTINMIMFDDPKNPEPELPNDYVVPGATVEDSFGSEIQEIPYPKSTPGRDKSYMKEQIRIAQERLNKLNEDIEKIED